LIFSLIPLRLSKSDTLKKAVVEWSKLR